MRVFYVDEAGCLGSLPTAPPAAASKEASVKNHRPSPPHEEAPAPISPCDHQCANTQSHTLAKQNAE